jgi:UDP-glucose 4-epimerase
MALNKLMGGTEKLLVNLGTGEGITVMEMVNQAAKISGNPVPYQIVGRRAGDPPEVVASAGLAKSLLGWEAKHSDAVTLISTTWKAYQANAKERRV